MGFAPQRDPDVSGPAARAWLCRRTPAERAEWPGTVDSWLVVVNGAHLGWSVFVAALMTLRDVPGFPPAKVAIAGATHELMVWATDDRELSVDPDVGETVARLPPLEPPNYGRQFRVESDVQATQVAMAIVTAFCRGGLPIEPDVAVVVDGKIVGMKTIAVQGRSLRTIVHESIDATARCVREGHHAPH